MDPGGFLLPAPGTCQRFVELTVERVLSAEGHAIEAGPDACPACRALLVAATSGGLDGDKDIGSAHRYTAISVHLQAENRLDRRPFEPGLYLRAVKARPGGTGSGSGEMVARMQGLVSGVARLSASLVPGASAGGSGGQRGVRWFKICEWHALMTDDGWSVPCMTESPCS